MLLPQERPLMLQQRIGERRYRVVVDQRRTIPTCACQLMSCDGVRWGAIKKSLGQPATRTRRLDRGEQQLGSGSTRRMQGIGSGPHLKPSLKTFADDNLVLAVTTAHSVTPSIGHGELVRLRAAETIDTQPSALSPANSSGAHQKTMASFSRGFAFGHQLLIVARQQAIPPSCKCVPTTQPTPHLFRLSRSQLQQLPSRLRCRLIQTAARAKSATKPPLKPTSSHPKIPTATPLPTRISSYAEQLAAKGRVQLYEAPSHFWFRFSSISASVFCVSYTVYQYWSIYLHPPEGLAWWVPHAFGVVCLFMSGMGGWFLLGTSRIVRSIDAVSVASAMAKGKGKGKGKGSLPRGLTASPQTTSPIYLEIQTQRMMPLMPRKRINLWPQQVQIPFRVADAVAAREAGAMLGQPQSLKARVKAERAAKEARERERQHTLNNIMTAPFRDAKKAMGIMASGIARAFNREGFAKIKVNGSNYKFDVSGGWAMDNGRALDRVLAANGESR